MPKIELSARAHQAIRGAAINPFRETGKRLENGNWIVDVDDDVFAAISDRQHHGESISDTIERVVLTSGKTLS